MNCKHYYSTTEEYYEIESIVDVFGRVEVRWYLVKWKGYEVPEWKPEHLLETDGCQDSIRDFWTRSGLSPAQKMYEDPTTNRCCVCVTAPSSALRTLIKAYRTRERHHLDKLQSVSSAKTVQAAKLEKRKQIQHMLDKV